MPSYSASILIDASCSSVFAAISRELSAWWGIQDKLVENAGMIFTVSWGIPWYRFKVLDFQLDELMKWEVIDANQKIPGLTGVEKEWVGTHLHWRLKPTPEGGTKLHFQHDGLVPEMICFDFCTSSWEHFLKERLVDYLHSLS